MLRIGRLAEGWIAPPPVRELVRYRYSLICHRTSAKAQIHGVMAKNGILPVVGDLWAPTGSAQLDRLELPGPTLCASTRCATSSTSTTAR